MDNLRKSYSSEAGVKHALDDFSFHIDRGEVLALLGRNGAGKTTAIKVIAGLIVPDAGTVRFGEDDGARRGARLGAVLEGGKNLYQRLNALDNLEYFGALRGLGLREARHKGAALVERFGLGEVARTPIRMLSRGMQQKIAIAVALVHGPSLLILDEPTLGVDYEGTQILLQLIRDLRAEGVAVLLTTHQLEVAEQISDRIAIIHDGRKVADALTDAIKAEFAGETYQIEFQGPLQTETLAALQALNVEIVDQLMFFAGEPTHAYEVLAALSPTPILRLVRGDFGLDAAYRMYTRQLPSPQSARETVQ
ncbi:ABC-2 type transport system ATP-binding protein [Xanthomonas arboricola]|uniref:ABC transporter ATP-binding protein n=1 Tax=Xanthomonas euroxanthea TaxID=2259622 RepID=UPI001617DA7D|nr:ABC transporter ATP-binding protein [Xanthomonas euroxanthea]MBB3815154.1 ABC-2 type transport system ATP-binding protein [Xanthomonas euroxanthea]